MPLPGDGLGFAFAWRWARLCPRLEMNSALPSPGDELGFALAWRWARLRPRLESIIRLGRSDRSLPLRSSSLTGLWPYGKKSSGACFCASTTQAPDDFFPHCSSLSCTLYHIYYIFHMDKRNKWKGFLLMFHVKH